MAKVTIVIEDKADGRISVVSDPNFETMCKMENSGHTLTPAHGVGIAMLNRAREISQSKQSTNIIKIPKVKIIT